MAFDDLDDLSRRVEYTATEGQTVFPFPFTVFAETDLQVFLNGSQVGLNAAYTVTGVGDDLGGNVVFLSGRAEGETVVIYTDTPVERTTEYTQNGPWTSDRLNAEFNRVMVLLQEVGAKIGRSLRSTLLDTVIDPMAGASDRAQKYLFFDSNGNPTFLTGAPSQPSTHVTDIYHPATGDTAISIGTYTPGGGNLAVFLNGARLVPTIDYLETDSTTITLAEPAVDGDIIETAIGEVFNVTLARTAKWSQNITATDGQTVLSLDRTYVPGNQEIEVFMNGSLLTGGTDYTESSSSTVTLTYPLAAGDEIVIWYGQAFDPGSVTSATPHYAQTAAEIAAGVSPADLSFPPGDVQRYGAKGDGTNESTAIQRMFDQARYSGRAHFSARHGATRTTYICGSITVYSNTTVTRDSSVLIQKSGAGTTGSHVFDASATLGTGIALTANATEGARVVSVADVGSLTAGTVVVIRDATYAFSSTGRNLEVNEVLSAVGTTVTLRHALSRSYATASSAEIIPLTVDKRGIRFKDIEVEVPLGGYAGGGIYFNYAYDCHVDYCTVAGARDEGNVRFSNSSHCTMTGGAVIDGRSQTVVDYGNGVVISPSCNHVYVTGVNSRNVTANYIGQGSRYCGFSDCTDVSAYTYSFGTHGDGNYDCWIQDCRSYGARLYGVVSYGASGLAPDKRTVIRGNEVYNCGKQGIYNVCVVGKESEDIVIDGNLVVGFGTDSTTEYGIHTAFSYRTRISNNTVVGKKTTAANGLIYAYSATNVEIEDNKLRGPSAGYGIIHTSCTSPRINRNRITGIDAAKEGIYGAVSSGVVCTHNEVDNDVQFTRLSGDEHRENRYATKKDTARGVTNVADGGTVTHGLISAPTLVLVSGVSSRDHITVTAKGATTFTLAIKNDANGAGTTQDVSWEAMV